MSSKDQEARELAQRHYEIEDGITQIFEIQRPPPKAESIGLLEVNRDTIAAGIMPIYFGPDPEAGINFPSVIVEVTPEEFTQLQRNELRLPDGWLVGAAIPKAENGDCR